MDGSRLDNGGLAQGRGGQGALYWPSDRRLFHRRRSAGERIGLVLLALGSAALLAWGSTLLQ